MADEYIQMQVRLENLKEGEAQKIARFMSNAVIDANEKAMKSSTGWSADRYQELADIYFDASEEMYSQINSKLADDGFDFVVKNQAYHYDALYSQMTGLDSTNRKLSAEAAGYNTSNPVWRGSDKSQTTRADVKNVGVYFSPSKEYAAGYISQGHASWDLTPQQKLDDYIAKGFLQKFYLPKDGFVDFRDQKIRKQFIKWFAEEEMTWVPTHYTMAMKRRIAAKTFHGDFNLPHWESEQELRKFLNKFYPDWKYTNMYEHDWKTSGKNYRTGLAPKEAQMSYLTRKRGTARSEYALFMKQKGTPAVAKQMAQKQLGGAIVSANLSSAAIYTAAIREPFQGKILKDWVRQIEANEKRLISAALRQSWIEGEALPKAAERIAPILAKSRRDMMVVTRTYYAHLAAYTRDRVWEENEDLFKAYVWDSILDNRTTVDICAPRDQKKYTLKHEPIGHNLPWMGGPGMAHWQCRSTSFPIIPGVKRRTERQAISAGKNYESGDNVTRTGRVRVNTKAARDRGIYKDTTVKVGTTYEQWLKRQPKAFQEDVLGVAKAKAFRSGDWKLGEKFKPQNPTTVDMY